jgi:lysyl-tRNA synthetase class 2
MDEVAAMIRSVAGRHLPQQRYSYEELFQSYLGLDPHSADVCRLQSCAGEQGVAGAETLQLDGRDPWLGLLLTHSIEPRLPRDRMIFVYDYPASQAALARVRRGDPSVAARFELYLGGMEIANGFHELTDAVEQRARFETDQARRAAAGQPVPPLDTHLLAALEAGLPDCAGVAFGLDRFLMWLTGADRLQQVLAFPFDRA